MKRGLEAGAVAVAAGAVAAGAVAVAAGAVAVASCAVLNVFFDVQLFSGGAVVSNLTGCWNGAQAGDRPCSWAEVHGILPYWHKEGEQSLKWQKDSKYKYFST